jgi:tetratricopeptide (TPR) repeat protein
MSVGLQQVPIWNIPFPRNALFTGREEILSQLYTQLQADSMSALSQPQAISGLGGIGKTQIAVEYAYQHSQDYQAVFWVHADTRENLIAGYVEIAQLLNLPQKHEQNRTLIVKAVLQWFKTKAQWLLILDNADELVIVREFLPPHFGGHILLTTRAQSMGRLCRRLEVEIMDKDTGALLLLRRASLVPQDASLETASASDIALAKGINEELDGLPLALDQAGAYIEATGCTLAVYRKLYQTHRVELLRERGGLVLDHPEPVATTWSLSFIKIEQANPAAAELLRFSAFLGPDAIPEEIIFRGAAHLGPILGQVAVDQFALNKAMSALYAYSLVRRHAEMGMFSIHRLVQSVLRDQMDQTLTHQWIERTMLAIIATINEVFPYEDDPLWKALDKSFSKHEWFTQKYDHEYQAHEKRWLQYERYLPHAACCAQWILQNEVAFQKSAEFLYRVGAFLNNLAIVYLNQGKFDEAESLLQQAFAVNKRNFGFDPSSVATIFINLTTAYRRQAKYTEAEQLLLWILPLQEQLLGAEHPARATILNNLSVVYLEQNKQHVNVESFLQHALMICIEHRRLMHHPYTAICLNNLATLYLEQSKYIEAKPLFQWALAIYERLFGWEHPGTRAILKNYMLFLRRAGHEASAVQLEALLNPLTDFQAAELPNLGSNKEETLSIDLNWPPGLPHINTFKFHLSQFVSYETSDHFNFHEETFQQAIEEALPKLLHFFRLTFEDSDYRRTIPILESIFSSFEESNFSYKELSLGDVLFEYELLNRKAFWKTEVQPDGTWNWVFRNGRHAIDWNKLNSPEYRIMLVKQWVMMKIVILIYNHRALYWKLPNPSRKSSLPGTKHPFHQEKVQNQFYSKVIEALEGISGDILSYEYSIVGKKPPMRLFDKADLRWLHRMVRAENFDLYNWWWTKEINSMVLPVLNLLEGIEMRLNLTLAPAREKYEQRTLELALEASGSFFLKVLQG